jgi:hypothetical protein
LEALEVGVEDGERLTLRVDYDRIGEPSVSGVITLRATTPRAAEIAEQLRSRIAG